MKKRVGLILLGCALLPWSSGFTEGRDFAEAFSEELSPVLATEMRDLGPAAVSDAGDESWLFQRFTLRIRPRGEISIPMVGKVQIVAETELMWRRPTPEGWSDYRP